MQLFGGNPPVPPDWVGGVVFPKEVDEALGDLFDDSLPFKQCICNLSQKLLPFCLACFEGLRNTVNGLFAAMVVVGLDDFQLELTSSITSLYGCRC